MRRGPLLPGTLIAWSPSRSTFEGVVRRGIGNIGGNIGAAPERTAIKGLPCGSHINDVSVLFTIQKSPRPSINRRVFVLSSRILFLKAF